MRLWCRLLPQAEHQLNLLRKSRVDPTKSAFEVLRGPHDFNANPWAPLGCKCEIHVAPSKRKTWEEHTKTGFYVGSSWDHYRCHEVWIQDSKHTRVGQTVFFKHKYLTDPITTPNDALIQATQDLCAILKIKSQ